MSNIPLIANLDDPTSPIVGETNLSVKEGLVRGVSQDDEIRSSARELLSKEESGEKKPESRRPSIDPNFQDERRKSSAKNASAANLESRRLSKFKITNERHSKSPYNVPKRRSTVKNSEIKTGQGVKSRNNVNPIKTRGYIDSEDLDIDERTNTSDIHDIQTAYYKTGKSPNASGEARRKGGSLSPVRNTNGRRNSFVASNRIRDMYFRAMKKGLARRKSEIKDDPEEFLNQVKEIKDSIRTPNDERIKDLVIVEKTPLERLKGYSDKYPLLKFRKGIAKIARYISLISYKIFTNPIFEYFILCVIAMNSIMLALDNPTDDSSPYPAFIDTALLVIYTVEMALKIMGLGFVINKGSYLRDLWNCMDFVIVVTAYIPYIFSSGGVNLTAFRSLRVLRPLRTISNIKALKVLILTLIAALGPLMDTLLILFFLFMIFSIAGLQLFMGLLKKRCFSVDEGIPQTDYVNGDDSVNFQILCNTDSDCPGDAWTCGKMIANPNWGITNFDTIPSAFLMVFQIVSLEGWSDMMYYLDRTFSPFVAVYFIGLIIIGTFFLLNLTLAVIKAEFTKNAHQDDDKKKRRKYWINNDTMFEKLEDKKGEVLKLMRKRKAGEIAFNKWEFKKDNLIALDADTTKDNVIQKRRRKMKQQNSKFHRGITIVGNAFGKLGVKHIARKSIHSIAQILKVFKKSRTEPETTTATGESTSALKRFFTNLSRKNTNDSKTVSSPMLDSKRRNTAARSIPNNLDDSPEHGRRASSFANSEKSVGKGSYKHMMSDRSEKPLADGQTNENNYTKADSEAVGTKREAANTPADGSKTPSLLVIPSIAEAHEHSEMSMNSPSKADNLPFSRTSFRKTTIGMKPETQIIRPIIAEKVRVRSGNGRKTGEPIAIINIAGIRNKTASASPEKKKAKKKLHRGRSNIQKSMVASELSISGEDQSLVELLEAADAEIKKKMNPDKNILLRKINMVNKFAKNPKKKPHRSSTRKISEALPSIFDLADEVNHVVELQNERELDPLIPTGILDDSDFLDSKQRYELLKKKKLERHSRKQLITRSPSRKMFPRQSTFGRSPSLAATIMMQNGAADTENNLNLQVKPLSRSSTSVGNKPAVAGSSTMEVMEEEEGERCIIDVRHLKAVADFDRYYDPISLDDVMPSLQEVQERKEEEEERRKLRTTKMKLRFTLTKADQRKAEARIKSYYDPAKSRPTLAMMSNVNTTRIKKKMIGGTEGTIVIQNLNANLARNNMSNGSSSNLRSSKTHSLKGLSRKKTGFSTHMTTARSTHHHLDDDDYLPKDKMHDFMEVLKKMKKPFENEAEIDKPEGEEEPKKADAEAAAGEDDKKNKKEKEFKFAKDFKDLRKKDLSSHVVTSKNWSGDNVLRLTNSQIAIDKIKKALNRQDFDIWRPGVGGILHAGKRRIQQAVESSWFNNIVLISVLLNTVILASQGLVSDGSTLSSVFSDLNFTFTIIFTIEMVFKIIALGLAGYARDKINLFDCFIVVLSLVEMIFLDGGGNKAVSAFRTVRLFRTFRVLRVTKLLRSLSYMKVIMGVITRSINKFILIFVLLLLFIFIYALLGMQIFGGNLDVSDNTGQYRIWQNFDSFISAFIVCFQIMTQENWNDLLFLTMRSGVSKPFSLVYLTSWIFIGNYVFLNLFLAILLDEFTGDEAAEDLEEIDEDNEEDDPHHNTSRGPTSDGKTGTGTVQRTRSLESSFRRSITSRGETDEESSDHRVKAPKHEQVIACNRSFYIFSKDNFVRRFCLALMHHPWFENSVLIMIAISSIKLGIDTYITDTDSTPYMISKKIDMGINIFFTIEMMTKIISLGFCFDDGSYLRESWNILDFIIVIASLLDMSVSSINLGFIKILRLLRTLRPLRFVTHNPSMRLIVTALLESKTAIFNVLIVIVMIWLMFAILAVNIVGDKMGYCSGFPEDESYYGVSEEACIAKGSGYSWTTPRVNYDNVFWAMLSLFVMSTQENWPSLMKAMADSDEATNGPSENHNRLFAYGYFIVYIFVGSFFLINLFIGVIFLEFTRAEKRENKVQRFLTPQQQRWIIMQKLVLSIKADVSNVEPDAPWMKKIFKIINHTYFDIFIMIVIILNILTMALTYDGSSEGYTNFLQYVNYAFSGIFMMELILKHLGLGFRRYWRNSWNKFDAFVVAASILDIVMDAMEQSFLSFIRVGPQLARVFRVLRVTRLFKLVRSFQGLQKIINTLIFSLPSLMNVGALSFLVYFIYSILGCFLFGTIQTGQIIDDQVHFRNAAAAFVTLFRSSTGENWYLIMFDTIYPDTCTAGNSSCGTPAAVPFWITFIVICQYIFLNLFILVLLQQFEEYHLNPDNPVNKFRETLDYIFIPHWEKYSLKHGGTHIHEDQLFDFFLTLNTPLGFKNSGTTKKEVAIQIMHMNIPPDAYGMLFYNDVIHAAFKRGFNNEPISDFTQFQYLLKEETKTRNKLETIKKKVFFRKYFRPNPFTKTMSLNLRTGHLFKNSQKSQRKIVGANPIPRILFMGMTMKCWLNYAIRTSEKMKAAKANGMEYVYSESDPDAYTDEESEHSDEDSYEESEYTESQYDEEEEEERREGEEEDQQEEEDSKLIKEEDEDVVSSQGGSNNNITEQQHLIEDPAKKASDNIFKYDSDEEKASLFDPNDPSPLYNNNPLSKNKFKIRSPKNDTKLTVTSRSRLSQQMDASRKSLSKLAATPNIVKTGVEGDVQEMIPRSVYNFADHEKLAPHSKNSLEDPHERK